MRLAMHETRVPAWAIAAFVNEHGAVYSSEILDRFLISEQTLRRRRPELRSLGIEFVPRGRGSFYVAPGFTRRLPTGSLPEPGFSAREASIRRAPD
jgi:hypothetical protein